MKSNDRKMVALTFGKSRRENLKFNTHTVHNLKKKQTEKQRNRVIRTDCHHLTAMTEKLKIQFIGGALSAEKE